MLTIFLKLHHCENTFPRYIITHVEIWLTLHRQISSIAAAMKGQSGSWVENSEEGDILDCTNFLQFQLMQPKTTGNFGSLADRTAKFQKFPNFSHQLFIIETTKHRQNSQATPNG